MKKGKQAFQGYWYRSTDQETCCDCGLTHRIERKVSIKGKDVNKLIKKLGGEIRLYQRMWRINHEGGDRKKIHKFTNL